ncbi:hypothetical protein NU688_21480 [Variovorax sp. ZS18.2.2]|uniref:hypothetical protein n=1 Tax=Variovorax sp. ZS18.2.2 TaxID=2971255 RepID=UPI0021517F24|nr:hypothetical protein [Variovorax sp. ZS18.2.2]MCR6478744.1 hypothetical protein [Variovorax sp. ZS18.2.2]
MSKTIQISEAPYLWSVIIATAICLLQSYWKGSEKLLICAVLIAPLSLLFLGKTSIGPRFIARSSPWGRRIISWGEVTHIEVLPGWYWIVLHGENKRLGIVGPSLFEWQTQNEDDELPAWYLEELALERDIPISVNWFALFKRSRGT